MGSSRGHNNYLFGIQENQHRQIMLQGHQGESKLNALHTANYYKP